MEKIVVFTLDEPRYALPLEAVIKVIPAVEIISLPEAPEIVRGVVNIQGEVIAVVDVRKRFELQPKEFGPDDRFIIVRTSTRKIVMIVDEVVGVLQISGDQMIDRNALSSAAGFLRGVIKVEGDLILIYDLDSFLSLNEEQVLKKIIEKE